MRLLNQSAASDDELQEVVNDELVPRTKHWRDSVGEVRGLLSIRNPVLLGLDPQSR